MKLSLLTTLVGATLLAPLPAWTAQDPGEASAPAEVEVRSSPASEDDEIRPTEHPFLWKVKLGEVDSYLYGTIHLPDPRVLAIPEVVLEAIDGVDALYTEVAMEGMMLKAMKLMSLPGKETIEDLLPADVYQRLQDFMEDKGLPLMMFRKYKIWAIQQTVEIADYLEMFTAATPLDQVVYERAKEAGHQVGGLETLEEQVAIFDQLTTEEQVKMLVESLDKVEALVEGEERTIEKLVKIYLTGDAGKVLAFMKEEMDVEDPTDAKLQKTLIDDRNKLMVERMLKKVEEAPDLSFFFAVGAAHYPGELGIIQLLKDRGFEVERIAPPERSAEAPAEPEPVGAGSGG